MTSSYGTDSLRRIAALPMYDFPHLREAHDAFWTAVADRLVSYGLTNVPLGLTRPRDPLDLLSEPSLLLGQTCEYPLAMSRTSSVRLVGTPRYTAPGCSGSRYRSFIVVRKDDLVQDLAALRGRRCAVNERNSNSGMNLLRAAVAPVTGAAHFFDAVLLSGSHRASVVLVAHGEADVAAIDCVSFAHLTHVCPEEMKKLRVLGHTPSSPSLPLISSSLNGTRTIEALRRALAEALLDPAVAPACERLMLESIDFDTDPEFTAVRRLERQAAEAGYPGLG